MSILPLRSSMYRGSCLRAAGEQMYVWRYHNCMAVRRRTCTLCWQAGVAAVGAPLAQLQAEDRRCLLHLQQPQVCQSSCSPEGVPVQLPAYQRYDRLHRRLKPLLLRGRERQAGGGGRRGAGARAEGGGGAQRGSLRISCLREQTKPAR